jgi:uncharacterized membrane protein YozB (DUF420 family)
VSWYEALPHVNASLNTVSAVLLVSGYLAIRRQKRARHAALMVSSFAVSMLFLTSYLIYHYRAGHTAYEGEGFLRGIYFTVLISHVVLAATVPVLASITLWLAFRGKLERHRKIARWTLPIWLYVSVTGVVVYVMLYVFS